MEVGIAENPVKAGPVESPEECLFGFSYVAKRKAAGAKQAAEKVDDAASVAPASCRPPLN